MPGITCGMIAYFNNLYTVFTRFHISENSLREYFSERNNNLLGEWTEITVEKQDVGKLNAIIKTIEGESSNE